MFGTYIMIKRLEIAITIWALWYTRNKLVHEGTNQGVGELVVFIRSYCTELTTLTSGALCSNQSTSVKWSLPPSNVVKVNVDVGFVFAQRKACSGVIIHDAYGQNLGACSRLTSLVSSVFATKALALIYGLRFALEIEINAFTWKANELFKAFRVCRFQYIGRSRNRAAHAMAHDGLLQGEDYFWVEEALDPVVVVAAGSII
ncbi:hypothetical protein Goari_011800 [Gossypium aridum]|uniref:RNase H type-1 domain-containing protein n=1 Tax=Gossypium aridum TaxID=34290 RepID=A0A7J8WYG2_GOSAI|nr:hypothetical protein [Gossypium aridum]